MPKEYLNFELSIEEGSAGQYPVRADSSMGQARARMSFDIGAPELEEQLTVIAARGTGKRSRGPAGAAAEQVYADPFCLSSMERLGDRLHKALFDGNILTRYEMTLHQAAKEGKGVRVQLRIQDPALAALPWEFLMTGGKPLALDESTPLVRYLELERPVGRIKTPPPIRVLGMIGASEGLDVRAEMELMERAIEPLIDDGTVSLTWVDGHCWRDLRSALNRGEWHAFHFIGHGAFDAASGCGQILFEPEESSSGPHCLPAHDLAAMLCAHSSLRLVVLNSCEGARASQSNLFSSAGSILAQNGIPAVVSMQYEISDRAALEFSRQFYSSLADGLPVEAAVSQARQSIKITLVKTVEWGTPVLHLRAEDGMLFDISMAAAVFSGRKESAKPAAPKPASPPPSGFFASSSPLEKFAAKVRKIWVEGVLEQKLAQTIRMRLGSEIMADEVKNPFADYSMQGFVETPKGSSPMAGEPVEELFGQFGSMLILGNPGSGKTVALLELLRHRLGMFDEDRSLPVPVFLNLSSWAKDRKPLEEWMATELTAKYQLDARIGRAWIANANLMPMLDGLDEVKGEAREGCVAAINSWMEGSSTGAAICCRFKEYGALPEKLALSGAIRLQPLSREEIFSLVASGGDALAGLRTLLERDSGLLIEARTPLMLGLMIRAFHNVPIDPATIDVDQGLAKRRKMIFDHYTAREFERVMQGGSRV